MIKIYLFLLKRYQNLISKAFFYVCFYVSTIIFYLTYSVLDSPDFSKYYKYFEYYSGSISSVNLEQGHIYFFLNYLIVLLLSNIYEFLTLNEIINLAVHIGNSLIFLFGCLGLKKYLSKKYETKNTYLVLSILCFLPPAFELRMTFKPEIIAFASLGWLFYFLNKFMEKKDAKSFLKFSTIFALLISSKISIAFLISIILMFEVLQSDKNIFKKLQLKHAILLIVLISSLLIENSSMNGKFINQVVHEEKYNNTAEFSFFTKFNQKDFIDNPNKYFFYDSFIGITLFDSFNDFFQFYQNSEQSDLSKDRKQFFKVVFRGGQVLPINIKYDKEDGFLTFSGLYDRGWNENNYIDETRMKISFIFSSVIYFLLFLFGIIKKDIRPIMMSSFIGMLIVSFSALGFFGTNNFNPNLGDSFKTFYYGYFLVFSFAVLFSEIFKRNILKKTISISVILFMLFFLGFPFKYSQQIQESIINKNSQLFTCEINYLPINLLLNIQNEINCDDNKNTLNMISPDAELNSLNYKLIKIPYVNLLIFVIYFLLFTKFGESKFIRRLE
tara:strand:+ start:2225 stop:3889 length:1665 start_codon:yes stop_codon:yes gene_type:complete